MTVELCARCDRPARHRLGTRGNWNVFCCRHADIVMKELSLTVSEEEGEAGWQKWKADHAASCPTYK